MKVLAEESKKMVKNDIYGNQAKYERIVKQPELLLKPASNQPRAIYYCKNKNNLKYFKKLFNIWAAKDLSYIRRLRLIGSLKLASYVTSKDFAELNREDIDAIVAYMHQRYKSSKSKSDYIKNIKCSWRLLFPELDNKGRKDETLCPYTVRHLSSKIDKSQEKRRNDRIDFETFENILNFFNSDKCMQLYLMLGLESLGRPQEICYIKVKDVEQYDDYSKIWISEHGKEGCGMLQCIDSHPYLLRWLEQHPRRNDPESYLFLNEHSEQLTPYTLNKRLAKACKRLGIPKITCYSLKRNGVTLRRLRGDSDAQIQHVARWSSTRQLRTYDKSDQEDALKISLVKKGLLKDDKYKQHEPKTKNCVFCNTNCGFNEINCSKCKRPLDRHKIAEQVRQNMENSKEMQAMAKFLKPKALQRLFKVMQKLDILEKQANYQ